MAEEINMRKLKWTKKKKEIQDAAVRKANQVSNWVKENQEALVVLVPAAAVGLKSAGRTIQSIARGHAVKQDDKRSSNKVL